MRKKNTFLIFTLALMLSLLLSPNLNAATQKVLYTFHPPDFACSGRNESCPTATGFCVN